MRVEGVDYVLFVLLQMAFNKYDYYWNLQLTNEVDGEVWLVYYVTCLIEKRLCVNSDRNDQQIDFR